VPLLLALGCVSTDGTSQSTFALCPDGATAPAASSLVLIKSQMAEGSLHCSGIVIAPTLVVTSLACAYRPSSLEDPEPTSRSQSAFYDAAIDLDRICDRARGWTPREDGSLASTFGKPLDPSVMRVYLASDPASTLEVRRVFASGAASPCAPGLALLELERQIEAPSLPLRFEDPAPQDALWLEGHCLEGRYLLPREQPSSVAALASGVGNEQAPPWSMLVEGSSLGTDIGGAVVAPTGALVGVIVSGSGLACADAGGPTFAVRISAFRKLLLETARDRGVDLRVEPFSEGVADPGIAACAEPAVAR
jgi:hypothetical protein